MIDSSKLVNGYDFQAPFSVIALGEPMTARTWIGTVLVLAGILFLAPFA